MTINPFAVAGAITAGAGLARNVYLKLTQSVLSDFVDPTIKFNGEEDYRARLMVPESYVTEFAHGPLNGFNGIVFPYTPNITYDMAASYGNVGVMHSNYNVNFYKNSSVGNINVSAKFTVQNDQDAIYYLTTMHLLRALTKMKYGKDENPGAPPPVCRFSAYGTFMLKNVPVVVSNIRTELPDSVDYYGLSNTLNPKSINNTLQMGTNFIPTMSTINITLIPMYSRLEQSQFSVDDYVNYTSPKKKGFM